MNKVYLLSGSNAGERLIHLNRAKELIELRIGTLSQVSHIFETEAWGYVSDQSYYNQCLYLESALEPNSILNEILSIETEMGRKRSGKSYTDRIIDIDILFYNNEIIRTKELTIPHPRLHQRKFALVPLAEIAKDFVHPVFRKSIGQILENCEDKLKVIKLDLI